MLTVYSTYGSPGASTTAIYLAAQWASSGRQVLLIETDAAAGSLSQKLGIQFTPGTASFMAAGGRVTSADLIEHAQDVLFNNFHVMPTPSSPSGAKGIAERFARLGEELRDISDSEMAIIVDGGRLTADARTSELTTSATAVLVVTRDNTQFPSLEHVSDVLVDDASLPGPLGLVATVGPSALKDAEWNSNYGLKLVGSVDLSTERGTDLSMFISRGKRKSRKLRGSLEKLADALYEFACPASAAAPRARLPANRPESDTALAETEAGSPTAESGDLLAGVLSPASPAPSPPSPPAAAMPPPQAPTYVQYQPAAPRGQPPGRPPSHYDLQPPAPAAYEPPPPQPEYRQPTYPQQGYPDTGYAAAGHGHASQHPPHPEQYRQPTYSDIAHSPRPVHFPSGHDQPQYPAPPAGHEPPPGYDDGGQAAPPPGQPVQPLAQPAPDMPPMQPVEMPPPEAPTVPTGSFRTWAVHLFGESAGGEPDDKWPSPGTGATA